MCECVLVSDGAFIPISINSNKMKFTYVDKAGKSHLLIDEFEMNIDISKATVSKVLDDNGKAVKYIFEVY